jgi:hypothetical protein
MKAMFAVCLYSASDNAGICRFFECGRQINGRRGRRRNRVDGVGIGNRDIMTTLSSEATAITITMTTADRRMS